MNILQANSYMNSITGTTGGIGMSPLMGGLGAPTPSILSVPSPGDSFTSGNAGSAADLTGGLGGLGGSSAMSGLSGLGGNAGLAGTAGLTGGLGGLGGGSALGGLGGSSALGGLGGTSALGGLGGSSALGGLGGSSGGAGGIMGMIMQLLTGILGLISSLLGGGLGGQGAGSGAGTGQDPSGGAPAPSAGLSPDPTGTAGSAGSAGATDPTGGADPAGDAGDAGNAGRAQYGPDQYAPPGSNPNDSQPNGTPSPGPAPTPGATPSPGPTPSPGATPTPSPAPSSSISPGGQLKLFGGSQSGENNLNFTNKTGKDMYVFAQKNLDPGEKDPGGTVFKVPAGGNLSVSAVDDKGLRFQAFHDKLTPEQQSQLDSKGSVDGITVPGKTETLYETNYVSSKHLSYDDISPLDGAKTPLRMSGNGGRTEEISQEVIDNAPGRNADGSVPGVGPSASSTDNAASNPALRDYYERTSKGPDGTRKFYYNSSVGGDADQANVSYTGAQGKVRTSIDLG